MKLGWRHSALTATGTMLVCLLCVGLARGQAGPEPRPRMAEEVFKNVQVLKGIPVDQFMATMGFFSASLGMSCEDCHSPTTATGKASPSTIRKNARRAEWSR